MTLSAKKTDHTALLRQASLRPTRQRVALARLLFVGHDHHITADALYAQARKQRLKVSLATVYNTLRQFVDVGLLRQVSVDAGGVYFDTNTGAHHHFYDERTGALTDVPATAVQLAKLPPAPKGRAVARVDVVIRLK